MLTALRIQNFVIVNHLELDFSSGMTAFTGETGAGKSIMIDALALALGERADATVIRKGQEKCDISAEFYVDAQSAPIEWLKRHDVSLEDGQIILRRVFYREGRSKCYINGQVFPLQKVKELSAFLVHIHGQHQQQALTLAATHREQLDRFAQHQKLLSALEGHFLSCQTIKNELKTLQQDPNQDKMDLLQFQIAELEALHLHPNEVASLNLEHQQLYHAYDYLQRAQQIQTYLSTDETLSICQALNQSLHLLNELPKANAIIGNTLELLQSALIQCEEASNEINHFSEQIQVDPERLQSVEARLSSLHQMARKYHVDIGELPLYLQNLQTQLNSLKHREDKIVHLEKAYQENYQAYLAVAMRLRESRQEASKKLAIEIGLVIRKLGMPKSQFNIQITPSDKMQIHGLDKIEYMVSTNAGLELDSLNKIASGGELSRISLAIQVITAQQGSTPTLLFDEVDVGIGGATAALVGQLLKKLGERLQVFCVTHQAQVAAFAHHHFVVQKHDEDNETYTTVIPIQESEKVDEIARMLGGLTITEQTRSNARELLAQSEY